MSLQQSSGYRPALAAVLALGIIGTLDFLVQPLSVGMAVRDLSLSESQAGYFASFDLIGAVLSAVLALFWIRRLPWRSMAIANLVLMAVGYLVATRLETLTALAPVRILVGFAGGNLLAISLAWLADTTHPERFGGLLFAAQTVVQIVAFALLPGTVLRAGGLDGFFLFFFGLAVLGLFCVPWIPIHGRRPRPMIRPSPAVGSAERATMTRFRAALALLGVGLFFLNTGAFWSYVERIGTAADLGLEAIGLALSASGFIACAGSLAASRLGNKISLPWALGTAFVGQLLALGLLLIDLTPALYTLALGQFGFFWNFAMPYQLGALIRNDPSGRRVVLLSAFQAAGMAGGPPLVALSVDSAGLIAMHWVAVAAGAASLLLFLVLHRYQPTIDVYLACDPPTGSAADLEANEPPSGTQAVPLHRRPGAPIGALDRERVGVSP
ncbi:MAG: MFS transporter [Acidobacteriota bacterium]